MINYNVPFFPNTKEGTHCFQACLKMVLKYFWPKKDFTWKELEKITVKEKGMWTWEMAGLLWLKENGFEVKVEQIFDYQAFALEPKLYLTKIFDQNTADDIDEHTVLSKEKVRALSFLKTIKSIKKIPEISDVKKYLNEGYLVVVAINSNALNRHDGYTAHIVLIKGFDQNRLIIHNPGGYPGQPNQKVTYSLFEKAWAYPNKKAKNIIAVKLS